ncbi:MAG: CHASE sensor domain-containing protein, partial [Candidatus Neomarinimicrobiota bacterium]
MKFFNEINLKSKLVVMMVATACITLILSFGVDAIRDYSRHRHEMFERVQIETNLVAEYCVAPLIFHSIEGIEEVLSKLESSPDFISAAVYDTTHTLSASFSNNTEDQPHPFLETHDSNLYTQKNIVHITLPIKFDNIQYGLIYSHYSLDRLLNTIIEYLILSIIIIGVFLIISYFIAIRLQRLIS